MLSQPYSGVKRIACSAPCVIEHADGSRLGVLWNLSVGGAYVALRNMPKQGEQVRLSFCLPGDPTPIRAQARVVWQNRPSLWTGCGWQAAGLPSGCGLQFASVEAADLARIRARVRNTYPDLSDPAPSADVRPSA